MVEMEAKIKEVIPRAYNVKSFRLQAQGPLDFKAGQFMCVRLKTEQECKRYLSISSSPTEKCYLEFTKKITDSDFSRVLNGLKTGDSLDIQYPLGKFTLEDNAIGAGTKMAFLSGGIGITPIRSITKFAVDKQSGVDIILVYANRSIKDVIFKEDFDAMQKEYAGLKVAHVLCEPAPAFKCSAGLINAQVIKNEIPDYKERKFFICGPPGMVETMEKILSDELALPKGNIITENFTGY